MGENFFCICGQMGISGVESNSPSANLQHRCQCMDNIFAPIRSKMKVLRKIKKRIGLGELLIYLFFRFYFLSLLISTRLAQIYLFIYHFLCFAFFLFFLFHPPTALMIWISRSFMNREFVNGKLLSLFPQLMSTQVKKGIRAIRPRPNIRDAFELDAFRNEIFIGFTTKALSLFPLFLPPLSDSLPHAPQRLINHLNQIVLLLRVFS